MCGPPHWQPDRAPVLRLSAQTFPSKVLCQPLSDDQLKLESMNPQKITKWWFPSSTPSIFIQWNYFFYHEEPFLIHLGKLVIPLMGACSLFYILPSYLLLWPSLWLPVSLTLLSSPSPHCVHLHRFWTRMHLIFCLSTTFSASTRWGIHLPNTDMTPGGVKEPPDRETWTI